MLDDNSREVVKLTQDIGSLSRKALVMFLRWAIKTLRDNKEYEKTHGEISEAKLFEIAKKNKDEVLTIKDADESDHIFNKKEIEAIKKEITLKGGAFNIREKNGGYRVSFMAQDSQIVLKVMEEVASDIANGKFDSISTRLKAAKKTADEHNKTLSKEKHMSKNIGAR